MIYASHLHGSTRVQRDLSLGAETRRVPAVKRGWQRKCGVALAAVLGRSALFSDVNHQPPPWILWIAQTQGYDSRANSSSTRRTSFTWPDYDHHNGEGPQRTSHEIGHILSVNPRPG